MHSDDMPRWPPASAVSWRAETGAPCIQHCSVARQRRAAQMSAQTATAATRGDPHDSRAFSCESRICENKNMIDPPVLLRIFSYKAYTSLRLSRAHTRFGRLRSDAREYTLADSVTVGRDCAPLRVARPARQACALHTSARASPRGARCST